jgi:DNA-binding MarR family transcriptional regulator
VREIDILHAKFPGRRGTEGGGFVRRSGSAPNRRFIYLLNVAQRRVQQWSLDERRGVTSSQSGVLFLLGAKDGALIGDVAKAIGVGPSGISGLVDRMEATGLVRRTHDPQDGRAVRLQLTDLGWAARDAAKARAAAINARLVEGFTDTELDIVARWLTHVCERFSKGNDE